MKQNFLQKERKFGTLSFILLAFIFSFLIRLIWVYQFSNFDQFFWNDQLMINTNDGYYFAEGARDILSGGHEVGDLSPIHEPLSILTAFLAKLLPMSFETLILYMPTFFGSLIVVPIILIAKIFNEEDAGFFAALIGSITVSYYNRTMTGYYDTDMLVVILPLLTVWASIYALASNNVKFLFLAPIFVILGVIWHSGVLHIANGIFAIALCYTLIFERKNPHFYRFLAIFIIALTSLHVGIQLGFIVLLNLFFVKTEKKLTPPTVTLIALLSMSLYAVFGGYAWVARVLKSEYFARPELNDVASGYTLNYVEVLNTVREAGQIPFEVFAHRLSGGSFYFIVAVIGYMMLLYRHKLRRTTIYRVCSAFYGDGHLFFYNGGSRLSKQVFC